MSNSLYFDPGNGEFTKLTNIDSPEFTGTPTAPTPDISSFNRMATVEFVNKYIEDRLKRFGLKTFTTNGYEIEVNPNKEYYVNIYGIANINGVDVVGTAKLGRVVILNTNGSVIASSGGNTSTTFTNVGGIAQSATLYLRAPMNGILRCYVNYGGTDGSNEASYVCAVEIDRDEYKAITINQVPYQTINVIANGDTFTENCMITKNSVYKVEVVPDIGYLPGTITPNKSGVVQNDMTFNSTIPVYSPCVINITQTPNQTIRVENEGVIYTATFVARYGSTWTATITANDHYVAGTLNGTSGTVSKTITVKASTAKPINRTVRVVQSARQTITITRMDTGDKTTKSFSVLEGTRILAEIKADNGYIPGTLNVDKYFNADTDTVVSATPATPR